MASSVVGATSSQDCSPLTEEDLREKAIITPEDGIYNSKNFSRSYEMAFSA